MGRSITIHCIGLPYGHAMSRVEVVQEEAKARKAGEPIRFWRWQTKTGERILEGYPDSLPKLVQCPICEGDGFTGRKSMASGRVLKYECPVCRGSGLCKKGNERRWTDWQLKMMRKDRAETKKVQWLKAACPICRETFEYLGEAPRTCSKFNCIQEANKRGLLKR